MLNLSDMLNSQKGLSSVKLSCMAVTDEHYIDELIASNLLRLLFEKDMSQNELAFRLDVPPPLVNQIIKNKKGMGKDIMARVCNVLKVEPWEFYIDGATPIIFDATEQKYIYKLREAEALNVNEEIMRYADYVVKNARQKYDADDNDPDLKKLNELMSRHHGVGKTGDGERTAISKKEPKPSKKIQKPA